MPDEIKILVASQRKEDVLFFNEAVRLIHYKVIFHQFRSGVMLMQYLLKTQPKNALVFFETDMPYKNGFECLAEIRRNPEYNYLNLVMLTRENKKTIINAVKGGVNYVIRKPDCIEDMKAMILYFLEEQVKPIPGDIKKYIFAHTLK